LFYSPAMKRIAVRDEFEIDAPRYWRDVFFSQKFQERMYREALSCEKVEFLEEKGSLETGMSRRLRFAQRMDAPAPVRKIFGETTTMEETGTYDPATGRWKFRMIPDRMADKLDITGETWVEPAGPGKIFRHVALDVGVRIFAVGGLVESFIASTTEERFATQAAFTRKYVSELKAS
jgi:hypothetical protein